MSCSTIESQGGRENENEYESALAGGHDVLFSLLFRVIAAPGFNFIPS